MILAIEREWAKHPGWFWTLPRDVQRDLLADWRLRHPGPTYPQQR